MADWHTTIRERELAARLDTARSCAGATSATVKKALLFQAMERELQIVLPAAETVAARDVTALAKLVLRCRAQQPAPVLTNGTF